MNSLIKGDSGKISSMRVASLSIIVSVLVIFIVHNIVSMASGGGFVSVGSSEVALVTAALSAKAAQRFAEGKKPINKIDINNELPITKEQ